jgi:hypothetical protein
VLGNASGIVTTMDVDGIIFHQQMDNLNLFLRSQKVEPELCSELRAYFRAIRQLMRTRRYQILFEEMSPQLRETVIFKSIHWIAKVPWCKGISKGFISTLVQRMEVAVYSPNEVMPSINHLCVINRGVASKQGKVLLKGASYGVDIILQSTFLKQKTPARALTFTELLYINRAHFLEILDLFPADAKLIRKYAILLALRRGIMLMHTFSKCGWKFSLETTLIPFVTPQNLQQGIGEKYEKFVQLLNPQLSSGSFCDNGKQLNQLIRSTEQQELEVTGIKELMGPQSKNMTSSSLVDKDVESQVADMEEKVGQLKYSVQKIEEAINLLMTTRYADLKPSCNSFIQQEASLKSYDGNQEILFINNGHLSENFSEEDDIDCIPTVDSRSAFNSPPSSTHGSIYIDKKKSTSHTISGSRQDSCPESPDLNNIHDAQNPLYIHARAPVNRKGPKKQNGSAW